jgi:deazaflavin-dependent oxidoreductase (nitroreductase family)
VTTELDMTQIPANPHAPAFVRRSNGFVRRLLGAGVPMGPNALVTIRGRTSGEPRTTPLAIVEIDGRRWVIGAYGDVQWTRNLRAAGEATIQVGSRDEHVRARELGHAEAAAWFRDQLVPYATGQTRLWRAAGQAILKTFAPEVLTDPDAAAQARPVFELLPMNA